jgi:hypothetical protein
MTYVFVGMGMFAFLGASMLAIDVGMLMTARNQAQKRPTRARSPERPRSSPTTTPTARRQVQQ